MSSMMTMMIHDILLLIGRATISRDLPDDEELILGKKVLHACIERF